eukprot:gene13116-biopygen12531
MAVEYKPRYTLSNGGWGGWRSCWAREAVVGWVPWDPTLPTEDHRLRGRGAGLVPKKVPWGRPAANRLYTIIPIGRGPTPRGGPPLEESTGGWGMKESHVREIYCVESTVDVTWNLLRGIYSVYQIKGCFLAWAVWSWFPYSHQRATPWGRGTFGWVPWGIVASEGQSTFGGTCKYMGIDCLCAVDFCVILAKEYPPGDSRQLRVMLLEQVGGGRRGGVGLGGAPVLAAHVLKAAALAGNWFDA